MEKIKDLIFKYKIYFIYGGVIFILLGLQIISFIFLYNKKEQVKIIEKEILKEEKQIKTKEKYYVDIKGEVINPGVYQIEEGQTIKDAITLAGGLTENANTKATNLSLKVKDEMVIIIYSNDEITRFKEIKQEEQVMVEVCNSNEYINNDSCIKEEKPIGKISINTATKEELMTLTGIGESKAITIIEYREQNGMFNTIEDLLNVKGIGESLFDKIKENITT